MHLRKILIHCGFKVSEPGQCCWSAGLSEMGGGGMPPPQDLDRSVNPILTRGMVQIMPTTLLLTP